MSWLDEIPKQQISHNVSLYDRILLNPNFLSAVLSNITKAII